MIKYKLVISVSASDLGDQVTQLLDKGWSLYGSPCVERGDTGGHLFTQAVTLVVKELKSNK